MMPSSNTKPTFKAMQIVHLALMAGVLMFLITTFAINSKPLTALPANQYSNVLFYIAIGVAVVSILASTALYNSLFNKIDTTRPVEQKLPQYFSANIVRWALLEGAALFNVVVFLLSGAVLNVVVALLLIAFMASTRPTRQKATDDLKISYPQTLD